MYLSSSYLILLREQHEEVKPNHNIIVNSLHRYLCSRRQELFLEECYEDPMATNTEDEMGTNYM